VKEDEDKKGEYDLRIDRRPNIPVVLPQQLARAGLVRLRDSSELADSGLLRVIVRCRHREELARVLERDRREWVSRGSCKRGGGSRRK